MPSSVSGFEKERNPGSITIPSHTSKNSNVNDWKGRRPNSIPVEHNLFAQIMVEAHDRRIYFQMERSFFSYVDLSSLSHA